MAKLESCLAACASISGTSAVGRPGPGRVFGVCPGLRRCFDRVEFELLPGTGHLPYEECPETLTRIVNSFLTRMREAGPQLVRSSVWPSSEPSQAKHFALLAKFQAIG